MTYPSEPYAMWDTGASHFLIPLDQLPKNATNTSKAVVKLAVGETPAVFWKGEVFCKECRTPLVPANRVINTLGLVMVMIEKKNYNLVQNT